MYQINAFQIKDLFFHFYTAKIIFYQAKCSTELKQKDTCIENFYGQNERRKLRNSILDGNLLNRKIIL